VIRKEKLKSKQIKINRDVSDRILIYSGALEERKIHQELEDL